ncbi:MAG: hypothetical protein K6E75_11540 [Lachnospiraceae bacterium]|nr:hypothetical protein [Lachnospiraceae bacterium]
MTYRRKGWLVGGIMAAALICMTGCGDAIPELSEQQTEVFTEYAAGAVLKEMPQSNSRLVDTSVDYDPSKMTKYEKQQLGIIDPDEPSPQDTAQDNGAADEGLDQAPADDMTMDPGQSGAGSSESAEPSMSVAQITGIDGLDVKLKGFSVMDNYPEVAEGTDLFFAMNASEGTKLIVAKLTVQNTGSEPMEINNVARSDIRFKLLLNGESAQNAIVTLLNDDLASLKQTFEPGQSAETVLVCQVSEDLANSVSQLSVVISSDEGKTTLNVQ